MVPASLEDSLCVGETVEWDAFFRVNQPHRDYYLIVECNWDEVPGTQISYGEYVEYALHVKTRGARWEVP